jgi:2-(3-amino-3-carboxypropyl)histidine synthase
MEDDRAQVDLGIAADIEEAQLTQAYESHPTNDDDNSQTTTKQPKKRFVGRRAAAEAAAKNATISTEAGSGAIQGS